jgi:hypothetical protein
MSSSFSISEEAYEFTIKNWIIVAFVIYRPFYNRDNLRLSDNAECNWNGNSSIIEKNVYKCSIKV